MTKKNGWIPLDKEMIRTLSNIDRPYSFVEAMFSFTLDIENNKPWTIKGYSKLWGWSRNKVRKFVKESRTPQGHPGDTQGTQKGHPVHFIDKALWGEEDTPRTPKGHPKDTPRTPTINPLILDPNKKKKNTSNRFDEWWNIYPKKVGKKKSREKWKARNLDRMADKLIEDIQKRLCSEKWKNGFVPNPMTYLNGDRWEDELEPEEIKIGTTQHTSPEHLESERKRLRELGN